MIVGCPNCASKYRLQEGSMGPAGAKMKCPKCGLVFSARAPEAPAEAPVEPQAPAPVDTGATGVVAAADQEWDSMMAGALDKAFAPAQSASSALAPPAPSIPTDFDPLAEVRLPGEPAPPASAPSAPLRLAPEPRDPFYEANPLVYERPPADAAGGAVAPGPSPTQTHVSYASRPSFPAASVAKGPASAAPTPPPAPAAPGAGHDPFAGISLHAGGDLPGAAAAPAPPPDRGSSDPFANISVMTPAGTPLAGSVGSAGSVAPVGAAGPDGPAGPVRAAMTPSPMSAQGAARVRIKDRAGLIRDFEEISIARGFVTRHHDVRGLEISVDGAPFEAVLESEHFANVSMGVGEGDSQKRPDAAVAFPPPVRAPAPQAPSSGSPGLAARAALFCAGLLFVLSAAFAAWQFDLLPVEPRLSQFLAPRLGRRSPLQASDLDRGQRAQKARDRAAEAQKQGLLSEAAVYYRAALLAQPGDADTQEALHHCLQLLGDEAQAKALAPRSGAR